jgi:hypothetical protein
MPQRIQALLRDESAFDGKAVFKRQSLVRQRNGVLFAYFQNKMKIVLA